MKEKVFEFSKEVLPYCKEYQKKYFKDYNAGVSTSDGLVFTYYVHSPKNNPNNLRKTKSVITYCYADLNRLGNYIFNDRAEAIVGFPPRPSEYRKVFRSNLRTDTYNGPIDMVAEPYYNWLVNDSPWSPVFMIKDGKSIVENGFIADTYYNKDYFCSAMIATRFCYETSGGLSWLKFVDKGVNPRLAYILSHFFVVDSNETLGVAFNHHSNIPSNLNWDYIKSFINFDHNDKKTMEKELYCDAKHYRNISYFFGDPYKAKGEDFLYDFSENYRPMVKIDHKNGAVNPFKKRKTQVYKFDDIIDDLLDQIKHLLNSSYNGEVNVEEWFK